MRNLKNPIVILFCWSVGNAVYAKTSELLSNDGQEFVDPRLPKISAAYGISFEDEATPNSGIADAGIDRTATSDLAYFSEVSQPIFSCNGFFLKKAYLFVTSGISPPQSV